jgi:hypothetical protein
MNNNIKYTHQQEGAVLFIHFMIYIADYAEDKQIKTEEEEEECMWRSEHTAHH